MGIFDHGHQSVIEITDTVMQDIIDVIDITDTTGPSYEAGSYKELRSGPTKLDVRVSLYNVPE